ncbi:MAG: TrmH family RNA methyltransferase [Chitinophagales bacterium]|nr:RNA methyltransferase [Bacteroidota bacterium]MCB9043072.1 RNA methyltransferase [Chitinophagales bacterium]
MLKQIESVHNPLVKQIVALSQKQKERARTHLFVCEGLRELRLALAAGYVLQQLLFCPKFIEASALATALQTDIDEAKWISVSELVFQKIAYRSGVANVVAVLAYKVLSLEEAAKMLPANALVLVMDAIEKPGNIGAMLRTADGAGVDLVCICERVSDRYNPNSIRASLGAVFSLPIVEVSREELMVWLQQQQLAIKLASLQGATDYVRSNFRERCAIVMGSEAQGLEDSWYKIPHEAVYIVMMGVVDSLNVSTSAAVLLYEARRQKNS